MMLPRFEDILKDFLVIFEMRVLDSFSITILSQIFRIKTKMSYIQNGRLI